MAHIIVPFGTYAILLPSVMALDRRALAL